MKKIYNKLCAIAFALLGATSLSAQTDVTSTYLTNADFSSTDGWTADISDSYREIGNGLIGTYSVYSSAGSAATADGTHLSSEYCFGFEMRWGGHAAYTQETKTALIAGLYTLTYDVQNTNSNTTLGGYGNLFYVKVGDATYTDTKSEWKAGATSWTTHSITFAVNTEATATISLGYGFGVTNNGGGNTPTLYVSHLKLTHQSLDDVSAENPADMSSLIVNPSFETSDLTGWTCNTSSDTGVKPNSNGTYTTSGVDGSYLFNTWWKGVPLTQTVANLPNGNYTLNVLVASGDGSGSTPDIYLLANGEHSDVYTISDGDNSKFHDISYDFKVTNGQATIGVVGGDDNGAYNAEGHWWYKADNFRLTYKGADVTLLQEAFAANYAKLEALTTNDIPTAFATQITNLKSTYATTPSSKADLNTANAEIQAIVDLHPSMVAAYTDLQSLITLCTNYASEDYSNVENEAQRTALTTAIATATTNGNNATSVAELTSAYNTLEAARQTFVLVAYPTSGNSYEMTFKIANPSFETGDLTGWTIVQYSSDTGVKANSNATYATTGTHGNYLFNTYWQGVPIKQTLTNLPSGTYTMTAAVASDGCTVYLTADSEHSAGITTSDKTVFLDTQIEFICTDGEVTIGAVGGADGNAADHKAFTEDGYWWYKADNFRLTRTFDATTMQTSLTALKTTAASLLEQAMEPSKKTALQSAYDKADTSSENPFDLSAWAAELETTIAAAQSSANDYSKIQEYINKTKVFVDESEVATYQNKYNNREYTSEDVEPVRRELNVMRFNAASEVFTQKIEVTGWTGDLANTLRNDQHWSGNTVSYYDANSWVNNFVGLKHTLTTTITLPQGSYVLKAAGRSSSDATLRLNIKNGDTTIETVEYTGKGDQGYGIDTSGAANFSAEGIYANPEKDGNGNVLSYIGRGWEWEFAKFELNAETTVTLLVEVDYNDIQNRFGSFSDITLWMDDDTYLSVNGGAIDAPLAQAKALNTLPMGNSEMSALTSAIALGEAEITTADQLNEALAALETAVANANTWRTAYNEAKAPLITEMELFESDYNDNNVEWSNKCAKGQLYTTTWQAYITAIQEAAVAKDVVTDGYDFATHTTALANARTAVDASIAVYANLKAEIGYANNYDLVVSSNQSDYTAAINTAQAVWDGGTKEDPSAEILAMQNFKVLDYNYVTETYPGVATLSEWSGNWTSQLESQHYDGLGNTGDKYYDNNVNGDFANSQTFPLPAGTYVFSGIGRASSNGGATSYIKVDDKQVNFPQKGDTGYGINTSGVADFTNEATYANNDNGRGWEYRFIEFTLTEETEVTLSYGISCTGSWGSVFAPQLRAKKFTMTDKADIENETKEGYMVSYDREFTTDTWTTVIVPFDYELPGGVTAEKLNFIAFNGPDNNWISFEEVTTLAANTPYILKNNSATDALFANLGIKTVYSTASTNSVEVSGATMKGTYKEITAAELVAQEGGDKDIIFINTKGEGRYIDNAQPADITFPAGRAYIVVAGSTFDIANNVAPRFTIFHGDDDITSIEETLNQKNEEEVIYDLAGRRIVKPTKAGIYIVNGKKMVIK